MRRGHTRQQYLDKMAYMRSINPGIEVTTDLIVGFPSETEEDFAWTMEVLEAVRYSQVFPFMYSPRPGTKAEKMEDDVPQVVKEERLQRVIALQQRIDAEAMQTYVGSTQQVLIDGAHPRERYTMSGRTDGFRPVSIRESRLEIGDVVDVRVTGVRGHWLEGQVLDPAGIPA
jgi:tRNA-2-methylthio-N6-dimethylallyladenosine synthase